jgi:hypothetical protein
MAKPDELKGEPEVTTDTEQAHIVNRPGGVILHHKDGSAEYYAYGARVPFDELAEHQKKNLGHFTDQEDRSVYLPSEQVVKEAHIRAAFADSGQVNSTSDPVPSNYNELGEEDAAQLVIAMQNEPGVQARLLLHERVHGGSRRMVIDAGSPEAKQEAEHLYQAMVDGVTRFNQTPIPDGFRDREREIEKTANVSRKSSDSGHSGSESKEPSRSAGKGSPPPSDE